MGDGAGGSDYQLVGIHVLAPYLVFSDCSLMGMLGSSLQPHEGRGVGSHSTSAGVNGATVLSVVFGWSEEVIVQMFSVLSSCLLPGPLVREGRLLLGLFWSASVGISGLPASPVPGL